MLTFEVFVYEKAFGVDPFDVFGRIKDLETGTISGVKPASQFKHLPLKGLWHQHFFSAQFIMNNIKLGLGSKGVQRIIEQVFSNGSPVVTQEMTKEVSRRVVHEPLDGRIEQNKITGEWIIFIFYNEERYYLCLSTHQADDVSTYNKIVQACAHEFPDLQSWIEQARRDS